MTVIIQEKKLNCSNFDMYSYFDTLPYIKKKNSHTFRCCWSKLSDLKNQNYLLNI